MKYYKRSDQLPILLQQIADPPKGLYCYGNIDLLDMKSISIVGSRNPTRETYRVLDEIVPILVAQGYVIISGCASGVDAYVHKVADAHGGNCIGVLGYGIDFRYPRSSAMLIEQFSQRQLIVTEYEPNTQIRKFQFIARNRIIAGLSTATIIVQAKEKSGSLITAQMALEYNRDVFVIPGESFSEVYKGSHQLLSEGAQILYTGEQLEKKSGLF